MISSAITSPLTNDAPRGLARAGVSASLCPGTKPGIGLAQRLGPQGREKEKNKTSSIISSSSRPTKR